MEGMGMMVMEEGGELDFSGYSSTTSVDDEIGYALNNWSPLVDWGTFPSDDDFHGMIESMMCGFGENEEEDGMGVMAMSHEPSVVGSVPSSTTTSSPGTPGGAEEEEDANGLRLVHLLMAAAEALSGAHTSRDLARVILVRLKELVAPAAAAGSNMERLAAHFTNALQGLLDGSSAGGRHHRDDHHHHNPGDVLAAFQLLQDMSPYVKFGHFTANQAILEAVVGDRRVHVIDYDIMEGIQWASLMQALASRKDGPPAPHLRITAVTRGCGGGGGAAGRKGISTVQETGRRLAAFAASIGQPFSFAQCRLDGDERFRPVCVRVAKGEAVVVNCMLHLPHSPHRATGSVASFLSGAASLNPKIITLVEEEEETRMTEGDGGEFVGRFMDALHRYSAVCDAMEAGFPMQRRARGLVERVFLGPRIAGAVGRAYRGGGEGEGGWGDWMAAAGFGRVGISCFSHCQARLLLGLFNDGYRVEEDALNKLLLSWKSRRLLSASIWSPPPPAAAADVVADQLVSEFLS